MTSSHSKAGMTAADGSGSGNSSNAADVGGGDAVTQTPNVSQHLTVMPDGRTSSSDSSDLGMARLPQIAENEISLGKKLGSGGFVRTCFQCVRGKVPSREACPPPYR